MVSRRAVVRHLGDPRVRRRWLTILVCATLTFVPLVGGVGYENGLVLSPLASLSGVAVGVDAVRGWRARDSHGADVPLLRLALDGGRELGLLALMALGIVSAGQLWQPGCDYFGGLLFFVMGPVLSAAMGFGAGIWGGVVGRRRPGQLAWGLVPLVACLVVGLWRLYADPVVFAYDPFWGYFSGSVYDEGVSISRTYLAFRGYNLLAWGAALGGWHLLVDPHGLRLRWPPADARLGTARARSWAIGTAVILAALASMAIGTRAARLGFTANVDSIAEVLSETRETEHFVIHYPPRSPAARSIDVIAAEHEFAWHRLEALTGRAPEGKVRSFVFAGPEQKRALMGAGRVQVAAPWRRQIYLDYRPFPHPVLHHELAHVFGATVGDPVFGVSLDGLRINVGLIEGLATALAPRPADRLDLHDQAAVLDRLDKRPPLADIMGPGFLTRSSRVAYTAAGSFCLWLIEQHGFGAMGTLYRTAGDFEAAYGTSLDALERDWLAFLRTRPGIRDEDVAAQAQRFQRRSVFQRPCAHRVEAVRREIRRAHARGRLEDAVSGHRELCALEPELPEHRLGLAQALVLAGSIDEARGLLHMLADEPELTVSLKAAIAERLGDLELTVGRSTDAAAAYQRALALPLGDDRSRIVQLKHAGAIDPELAPLVLEYFSPFEREEDAVSGPVVRLFAAFRIQAHPEHRALGSYLVARQLLNVQRPEEAVPLLEAALSPQPGDRGLPSEAFERAAREALLDACVQTGRFDRARAVLAELADDPALGNGHRLELQYWRERIAFFEAYAQSG